jgi:uncharacterized protein YkwD
VKNIRWWILVAIGLFLLSLAACEIPTINQQGAQVTPSPSKDLEVRVARHVFDVMNKDRASANLPVYQWDETLVSAGRLHNYEMSKHKQLSHQLPGEPELGTRLTNQGVQWRTCGENVAMAQPVTEATAIQRAEELHRAMINERPPEDGHRKNKLSKDFLRVGINVYIDAQKTLWLTEDYAG